MREMRMFQNLYQEQGGQSISKRKKNQILIQHVNARTNTGYKT